RRTPEGSSCSDLVFPWSLRALRGEAHPDVDYDFSMRLTGKTAFVTAAGQGIGRATAEAFAREGARVIATDVNAAALGTLEGCERHVLDVTDAARIETLAREIGGVDILFNCAGIVHAGTILDCTDEDWDQAFAINA